MSLDNLIQYRCRRGLLELDIILLNFFDHHYRNLPQTQKKLFLELLELEDNDLLYMVQDSVNKNHKAYELIRLIINAK
jgi:antitoxin CptB